MKKYTKLLKVLSIILLVAVFGYFIFTKANNNQVKTSINQTQNLETTLVIKDETDSPINISDFIGKTVLEATESSLEEIKTEGTGKNAYITSLNGKTADTNKNEFWELIINEKPSEVGAGSYIINKGDKIVWQINTF